MKPESPRPLCPPPAFAWTPLVSFLPAHFTPMPSFTLAALVCSQGNQISHLLLTPSDVMSSTVLGAELAALPWPARPCRALVPTPLNFPPLAFFFFFFFFFNICLFGCTSFSCNTQDLQSQLWQDQGLNPDPCFGSTVLATGPPGKSPTPPFLLQPPRTLSWVQWGSHPPLGFKQVILTLDWGFY